ncbi:MAG: hypothetical protein QNK18_08940 [Gammaproteobacteria bacterium]|nr:hypothetical protein [Gammaproteobacteria bacterium]MDJ0891301.1 hypothetical protein [Gammaproteobacteria bacterium]
MRNIALTIVALMFSASALADICSGNPDLEGWAVEDQHLLSVEMRECADVRAPFGNNPDQYGSVLVDETPAYRDFGSAPGIGDSYGSILHEVDFHY